MEDVMEDDQFELSQDFLDHIGGVDCSGAVSHCEQIVAELTNSSDMLNSLKDLANLIFDQSFDSTQNIDEIVSVKNDISNWTYATLLEQGSLETSSLADHNCSGTFLRALSRKVANHVEHEMREAMNYDRELVVLDYC